MANHDLTKDNIYRLPYSNSLNGIVLWTMNMGASSLVMLVENVKGISPTFLDQALEKSYAIVNSKTIGRQDIPFMGCTDKSISWITWVNDFMIAVKVVGITGLSVSQLRSFFNTSLASITIVRR